MAGFPLGPDTVVLVFRDPVLDDAGNPSFDAEGRTLYADRRVTKTAAKFTITGVDETESVATYSAKCALGVDVDSVALVSKDAVEHDGKLYEIETDPRVKRTLIDGIEHHVRVFCSRQEHAGRGELVTITPAGGQDFDGHRLPDGQPFDVLAVSVDPGNTAEQYGAEGTTDVADFTVVLSAHSGIRDGDWITVRGRKCAARVQRQLSQHAQRNEDVVLARFRGGGG